MKWKFILGIFALSIGGFLALIYHYGFNYSDIASLSFYENLANPYVRIVKIPEGLRKEEIALILSDKLGWSDLEKEEFVSAHLALNSDNLEGHYFPKTYMISKTENPIGVTSLMLQEFSKQTKNVSMPASKKIINPNTALTIASIIQREAAGKGDMNLISGIIWNRLFSGMKLQIDATLQYAKGSEEEGWWEKVSSQDKSINSPYNTYLNKGLPPSPIANPGLAAIEAAYNPQTTSCLYFLHDKNKKIHCAKTYEEHMKNIKKYL